MYFYTVVAAVVLGAVLGTLGVWLSLGVIGWFAMLSGALLVLQWRSREVATPPPLLTIPLFLLVFACMLGRTLFLPPSSIPSLEATLGTTVAITGEVAREAEARERTLHLYVDTGTTTILVVTDRQADVRYGDAVTVTGKLRKPEAFETDFGRTFNYPGYLRARGVSYTMHYALVEVVVRDQGNPLIAALLSLKHGFMSEIERLLPSPQVGLAEGLLLGVKRALGETYEVAFRETGIMHIVVLSGYNIMLVVSFFMYVLAYLLPYRTRLLVGLMGVTCFALLVGLSATVLRASIMAEILLFMRFGGMTHHVLRALFVAGVGMLVWNPLLLCYDIGFQLSFLATFALIVLLPYVQTWFVWVPTRFGIREFLVATITTQLFVTPLILFHMGQVSVVSVLVNVLVLPMVPIAMLTTFVAGALALVLPVAALPVAWLAHVALSYILLVATTFAALPFAAVSVPPFSVGMLALMYSLLLGSWWYLVVKTPKQRTTPPGLAYLDTWTIVEER